MKSLNLCLLLLGLSACANHAGLDGEANEQTLLAVDSIASKCGMPKGSWKLIADRDVTIVGGANEISSTAFMCFVKGLEASNPPFRLGFIAEPPSENGQ